VSALEREPLESVATAEASREPTVLVIDDIPYLLDVAALFLGRTARVVTAVGGRTGLEAARRLQPELVLCDDTMPEMDGLAVCRALRDDPQLANTPLVMLLSDPSAEAHGAAIRAGANDVISKPLERLGLVSAVSRFISPTHSKARGLPRIDTEVAATVMSADNEGKGTVRNLSRGGAFIETDLPLVCADEIGLRFQLPGSEATLRASAEVVWRRHHYESEPNVEGVGLRFIEIDASSTRALDDYVYEHRTAH